MLPRNLRLSLGLRYARPVSLVGVLLSILLFGSDTHAVHAVPPGSGQMSAKGHFYYYDSSRSLHPLGNSLVQLYDSNLSGDQFLGADFARGDGYWEIGPFSSAGADGGRHLYVRVRTENANRGIRVENTSGETYSWRSEGTVDVQLDGWVDFGQKSVPDTSPNKPAVWIFMTLNRGWEYLPSSPGSTSARWATNYDPSCGMCFDPSGGIVLLARDAPESPDVVLHEFAHNAMFNVYGSWLPKPEYSSSGHWISLASGPNAAWMEGWAEFLPLTSIRL